MAIKLFAKPVVTSVINLVKVHNLVSGLQNNSLTAGSFSQVLGILNTSGLPFILNNMSDSFKADWQSFKYIGRAENFYKYSGFSRDVSLSFTIYAHSFSEMKPLYEKLNYLVGVTAPSYSNYGYMRGNFVNLRVGDYLNDVPGIITNIGLKPSFEGGWEIGRDALGAPLNDVKKLPKLIEVDLSFTPVHNFTPVSNRQGYIG